MCEYAEKISQPGEFLDLLDATMMGNVVDKDYSIVLGLEMFGIVWFDSWEILGGLNVESHKFKDFQIYRVARSVCGWEFVSLGHCLHR